MPAVFVYGALMDRSDLGEGRAATVEGHAVRFVAPGVPLIEPCFAALVPAPDSVAHGVVYELDADTWQRIVSAEHGYRSVSVEALTREGAVRCQALIIPGRDATSAEGRPSARYAQRLVDGARRHGLPDEVVTAYRRHRERGSTISLFLVALYRPVARLVPHLGLGGAMAVVLAVLGLAVAAVVGGAAALVTLAWPAG